MNSFVVNIISSLSIILPAVLILCRWRKIAPAYHPFAILLWIGTINELISLVMILNHHPNMFNSNIYVLLEYALLIRLFMQWNRWNYSLPALLLITGIVIWIIDNIWWHSITSDNSFFRMMYSSTIVLFSMFQCGKIVMHETRRLYRNAQFVICLTFVIYYTFKTFFESYNLLNEGISEQFFYRLWLVLNIVNLFANLSYFYAILCIKKRMPFTLPY